jgi:biotin carboxyl carrier protein
MENNGIFGFLNINTSLYKTRISEKFANRKKYQPLDQRKILSFIPGTVLEILVVEGQKVEKGDTLLILEAMKMKNRLKSSIVGNVRKIHTSPGERVSKGTLLIEMD